MKEFPKSAVKLPCPHSGGRTAAEAQSENGTGNASTYIQHSVREMTSDYVVRGGCYPSYCGRCLT